ncbi:MAG: sigma-54 dependent transcriptional regulator [Gammaproteobacteria bacterium]|nr:sigma-54 dependent transcriptional regulator [Gammaproteobacteria bacterium]MDH4313254.1 sigma-54 dependent transcriptional regulator [Gammaproteobacteria bacterium]MDH5501715.1 sigma-54 dependent transcriptional regulator [Gammaproteobacteria bacterium]
MVKAAQTQAKVLVLDSDPGRAAALCHRLRFLNYDPVMAGEDVSVDSIATQPGIALMLGDISPDDDSGQFLRAIAEMKPDLPFLLTSGELPAVDPNSALGSHPAWKLDLPLRKTQLQQLLRRAERYEGSERRQRLTGSSPSIREVRELIEQVADFDTNVLITGESGTGKELVARTLHELSDRADKPFVPINCGAIPAELLESELFGHEKGAFTGAIAARTGRFELAEGGTLFLDEIGDMSLPMQVKLLRVLQERAFEKVGSNTTQKCNVRIVAATHRNLPEAVKTGEFREDLFYRLNVFPIEMPPLCKRASDLPQLLTELLQQHQQHSDATLRVSAQALNALAGYSWPGNIRELSNLVERLAILKPTGVIELEDLPEKYRDAANHVPDTADSVAAIGDMALSSVDLKAHLQAVERDLIRQAMDASGGVTAKAARLLKMRRTTLVEKLARYEIH